MPRYFLILILPFLIVEVVQAQSIVVAIRTSTDVIVGTDSRINTKMVEGRATAVLGCKLHVQDSMVVVLVGLTSLSDVTYDFDGWRILSGLLNRYRDLGYAARVDSVASGFRQRLQDQLRRVQRDNPPLYASATRNLTKVLFAYFAEDTPTIATREYELADQQPATIDMATDDCGRGCTYQIAFLGDFIESQRWLNRQQGINLGPSDLIDLLILLQAQATPEVVTAPVDKVVVGANGIRWLRLKPGCMF